MDDTEIVNATKAALHRALMAKGLHPEPRTWERLSVKDAAALLVSNGQKCLGDCRSYHHHPSIATMMTIARFE